MTDDLPNTIQNPDAFRRSPPAGFDGVFDWSWTEGCWANPRDKPMDLDFIKERRGQFLIMETKRDKSVPIPRGQMIAFERLHALGCFAVMLIYGKPWPQAGEFWFPGSRRTVEFVGVEAARDLVRRWYAWADQGGRR